MHICWLGVREIFVYKHLSHQQKTFFLHGLTITIKGWLQLFGRQPRRCRRCQGCSNLACTDMKWRNTFCCQIYAMHIINFVEYILNNLRNMNTNMWGLFGIYVEVQRGGGWFIKMNAFWIAVAVNLHSVSGITVIL